MNAQTRAAEGGDRPVLDQLEDMSLVAGGPLFRLWRRAHLAGDALEHVRRRVLVLVALTWLPLLLLSVFQGRAWGGDVKLPFLYDIETHLRLLVTLPLLIVAELQVHRRLPPIVRRFIDHGLIAGASRAKFDAAIASALRWRNSVARRSAVARLRVRGRRALRLGRPDEAGHDQLVRDDERNGAAPVLCRPVDGTRQHADLPVPGVAMGLQVAALGPLPAAGVPHGPATGGDASRRHGRPALPVAVHPRLPVAADRHGRVARRHDRRPDLLRGREADGLQARDRRHRRAAGAGHPRADARVRLADPAHEAQGHQRIQPARPGLRA